ncbi:hypothetical protein JCM19298_1808 [Nonlabens ulvanivorans]|nr:hypothetical protein [Nonlabens ulvanivorans]GAK93089.1 hypothetical protein JCM19298_1808 [Nonlabens ulvanivorans]
MRSLIAVLFLSLFLIGCKDNATVNQQILNRIPTDSKIIIATNDIKNLNDLLSSSALLEEVKELKRIQELKIASAFLLDYDLKGESIISISPEARTTLPLH